MISWAKKYWMRWKRTGLRHQCHLPGTVGLDIIQWVIGSSAWTIRGASVLDPPQLCQSFALMRPSLPDQVLLAITHWWTGNADIISRSSLQRTCNAGVRFRSTFV